MNLKPVSDVEFGLMPMSYNNRFCSLVFYSIPANLISILMTYSSVRLTVFRVFSLDEGELLPNNLGFLKCFYLNVNEKGAFCAF